MSKQRHKLYYHKTDGGAEYLCTAHIDGCNEGDLSGAIIRLDGGPVLLRGLTHSMIAAAPDLLAALRPLVAIVNGANVTKAKREQYLDEARAAIAKAAK